MTETAINICGRKTARLEIGFSSLLANELFSRGAMPGVERDIGNPFSAFYTHWCLC